MHVWLNTIKEDIEYIRADEIADVIDVNIVRSKTIKCILWEMIESGKNSSLDEYLLLQHDWRDESINGGNMT